MTGNFFYEIWRFTVDAAIENWVLLVLALILVVGTIGCIAWWHRKGLGRDEL